MRAQAWAALILAGLIAGCASKPTPAPAAAPAGTGEGKYDLTSQSATCGAPQILPVPQPAGGTFTLNFSNDGGWCALRLTNGGQPFEAGLLHTAPMHGVVYIHRVAGFTRIDYTPDAGFVGTDSFFVKLLPGYIPVTVNVTITKQVAAPIPSTAKP